MTTTRHLSRIVIFAATALLAFTTPTWAQSDSLRIDPNGDVGIGTTSPSASLHVQRSDGTAKLMVEETNGTVAPRGVFEIRNNGQTAFVFNDTNEAERWIFSTLGSDLIFDAQPTAGVTFRLFPNGDLTILGQITTAGACSGGCDYVFDPGYELESIDEHAAHMWEHNHLPGVGPTTEGNPV